MRKLPIPFSDPMVAAIIAGRKTQTRRILDPQPFADGYFDGEVFCDWVPAPASNLQAYARFSAQAVGGGAVRTEAIAPRYAVDDLLYVRETYYQFGHWEPLTGYRTKGGKQKWAFVPHIPGGPVRFEPPERFRSAMRRDDPYTPAWHKRLGRFMPRSASRITLRVTGVKVERLHDISEADAKAEGIEPNIELSVWRCYLPEPKSQDYWLSPVESFRTLWESINGPGSWNANPWVVAIEFQPIFENIDKVKEPA